ncbi:hypothetical protein [Streptomyces sp. NBC_00878]|uniref:hypothetical protein n=1 Tax=Streptomyces sp. NBC_00878 TaxID=2975854 RepID=UPI00225A04FB|nr:hypothetical protein [Streptomyces sp. NBC_00878]MCX4903087.1 hypothetical protein [Streptomyces sp. NBC_00878]
MSSRTPQRPHRVTRDTVLCPALASLAVLLTVLVMCLGYMPSHGGAASAADPETVTHPLVTVSVAEERLGSPAEHDQCCGLPTRESRAVLPVGAHPLPAVLPRMPVVARPVGMSHVPVLPPARGAPDLHVLQVQRI